jgi:hypothetical protein
MRLAVVFAALLLVPPMHPDAGAAAAIFDIFSLADGKRHCFETFAEKAGLDPSGAVDNSVPVIKAAAQFCFITSSNGESWCRWNVKPLAGGEELRSWVLTKRREMAASESTWRSWWGFSEDWSEAAMTGLAQACTIAPVGSGGGVVLATQRSLASRRQVTAAVNFGADGARVDRLPLPSQQAK